MRRPEPVGTQAAASQAAWVELSAAWARGLDDAGRAPRPPVEIRALTGRLSRAVVEAIGDPGLHSPGLERVGDEVGRAMVEAHLTSVDEIGCTVAVLGRVLFTIPGATSNRVAVLTGGIAAGHSAALRALVLAQQEEIHAAVMQARDEAEAERKSSEARFRAIFTEAAVGIGIGDVDGHVLDVNPALLRMLGFTLAEFRRRNVAEFMHPDDAASVWADYRALVSGTRDWFRTEKRFFRSDGQELWTKLSVSLIRDGSGRPTYQVAVIEDMTAHHHLEQRLRHEATHDPLTDLPNRALFLERLTAALSRNAPDARIGLCFLDLDNFKAINDTLGHWLGDQVLRAVATRLSEPTAVRGGLLARIGGDEFVVLLESSPGLDAVTELADELVRALVDPIPVEGHRIRVGTSVGIVEQAAADMSAADLLRAADITLHLAKADGRGRAVVHDPVRNAHQETTFTLATALPGALERGEFAVVYQPLVALSDGGLHGVEALLRWEHPRFGPLGPDRFVAIAEETGAIIDLGRWVLEQACRDAAGWSSDVWPDTAVLSVNISVRQLQAAEIVADISAILDSAGLSPKRLQLEITESVVMTPDLPGPLESLRALARMGVRIAIDDFGTGYSNLAALHRLPLDELKLAGAFLAGVRSGDPGSVDARVMATLVDLAHALGLSVTAEGVETAEQDRLVRRLGCDVGQGWFYARPGTPETLHAWRTA